MKYRIFSLLLVLFAFSVVFAGCSLNEQGDKEKMAFKNTLKELKATNMMEGKIGNVKGGGNEITLDFTDPNMTAEDMQKTLGFVITVFANNNNSIQTGQTNLRVIASSGGKEMVKVVYTAGPSHSVEQNLTWTWIGIAAPTSSGTTTPPPAGTQGQ